MAINTEFSKILTDSGLGDVKLADILQISVSEVSMIKDGTLYPNEELVQEIYALSTEAKTEPKFYMDSEFQKGKRVGNKVSFTRTAFSIVFIIFISAMMTGFGYQPMWVFLLVLCLGLFLTLPACFESFWIIHDDNLELENFSNFDLIKMGQLLNLTPKNQQRITYSNIHCAAINYHNRTRISPFDIQPDYFKLNLTLNDGKTVTLGIDQGLALKLMDFVKLLNHNGINVYDRQKILQTIDKGENLFEHYNVIYN